jgi:hypothetical protein
MSGLSKEDCVAAIGRLECERQTTRARLADARSAEVSMRATLSQLERHRIGLERRLEAIDPEWVSWNKRLKRTV